MRFTTRAPSFVLLVAAALVALLALLATLQYRWLGQVSAGERERMQTNLRASTARFTQDFDREIGRIYFGLQIDESTVHARAWHDYAERYRRWQQSAPYPRLVRELYLVEHDPDDTEDARLSRFDPAGETFTPTEWPAEFASLRPPTAHIVLPVAAPPAPASLMPAPVLGDIPAVVIPATTTEPLHVPANGHDQSVLIKTWLAPSSYTVAVLDLDYLRAEFLPALARRYFASGGSTLDYNLTVATRTETPRTIYKSDPTMPPPHDKGDAQAGLFNVRFDEMDVFLPPGQDAAQHMPATPPTPRNLSFRVFRRTDTTMIRGSNAARAVIDGAGDGEWQLTVAHPVGSLDAAVTHARRRSLAISFGVLLLLAASIALLVVSTHRAQRLARQQMEFVAGVTHELRTPLAVICSAGENLADGVIGDGAQVRRYGQVIRGEGRRLAEMVEQVLELAGAQRGRRKFDLRPLALDALIEHTLSSWQAAQDAPPQIERHVAHGLPPVLADESSLRRALQNLLSNAAKYGGDARWIGVSAQADEGAREVRIRVADHGLGIEPAELSHIFEPFYRGHEARAAQIHGNGLGLSLVKDIIEAHGGRVTVESERGRGSTFTLHLPVFVNGNGGARVDALPTQDTGGAER
jgi:signal transduction histidine kinase